MGRLPIAIVRNQCGDHFSLHGDVCWLPVNGLCCGASLNTGMPLFSELNEIRKRAGLPLLEMTYYDAVEAFRSHGIEPTELSSEELKKVRNRLNMKLHPDRGGSVEDQQEINQAYDILKMNKPGQGPAYTQRGAYPGAQTYRRPPRSEETPTWAWAGYSGGMPPMAHISREDYTDVNYIKKRMWELSGKSKDEWTIMGYDGRFFRAMTTVYGSPDIFNEMAEAMRTWQSHGGNPYPTRAVFVEPRGDYELYLVYLDGHFLGDNPTKMEHDSPNMNPANDQSFMRRLPDILDEISEKL